jgi:hypothetical protein
MVTEGMEGELLLSMTLVILSIIFYLLARSGMIFTPKRRLAAVDAMEEYVGRATEMGRPVHYTPGATGLIHNKRATQLAAGYSLLGYVAKLAAKNGIPIYCTVSQSDQIPLAESIIREAYVQTGHPELFRDDLVRFYGPQDESYASGIFEFYGTHKPAVNFLIGGWSSEVNLITEAGAAMGIPQISGTGHAAYGAMPMMIATSDYVLIIEELYAASAQASGDPVAMNFLAAQDIGKAILMALMIIGLVLAAAGNQVLVDLLGYAV